MTHKAQDRRASDRRRGPRRIAPRYIVKRDWVVSLDSLYRGDVGNLSTHGLFVRSDKMIPVNTIITIDFMPPDSSAEKVSVDARVVWTRKDRQGNAVGMGVEFLEHPKHDNEVIGFYIDIIKKAKDERD